jgi:hypothetical protein
MERMYDSITWDKSVKKGVLDEVEEEQDEEEDEEDDEQYDEDSESMRIVPSLKTWLGCCLPVQCSSSSTYLVED